MLDENNKPVPVESYTDSMPRGSKSRNKIAIENNPGHKRFDNIIIIIIMEGMEESKMSRRVYVSEKKGGNV